MKIDKIQFVVLALVISICITTAAYATISYSWSTTNRLRVASSSLGVYQDQALSQPVSDSTDWGSWHPGDEVWRNWWVKNEGGTPLTLSWSSELNMGSVSSYVSNVWLWNDSQTWRDLNGYSLAPGVVVATRYVVFISTLTPSGTYSWGLTLSGGS